jgi:hypothetical protein
VKDWLGIKVSRLIWILHLLFVDDILIMTKASITEWLEIKKLLATFCSATGLLINSHKSSFYQFGVQQPVLDSIKAVFTYSINNLANGFKYLGYILKADRFKAEDWNWLLMKYENRINHWCNRWLTLGGQLVLAKAVLESQPIYWLALDKYTLFGPPQNSSDRLQLSLEWEKKKKGFPSV